MKPGEDEDEEPEVEGNISWCKDECSGMVLRSLCPSADFCFPDDKEVEY